MGNQDSRNRIPRNVAIMKITLLCDSVAGLPGTPATVYKNDYDGYKMETGNGFYSISLSTLRNGHFVRIESMETMPPEPSPVSFEELREEYRRQYNRLYNGDSPEIETEERAYSSIFEIWRRSHVDFLRAFVAYNGDFITSDREYAAMMLALMRGDFCRREEPKKPRPIKTRTYNNFMKVYKMILAKGYSPEESEEITRGIFDDFERQPFGMSILGRVSLIVEKPETVEESPETTPATAPEESAAEPTPEPAPVSADTRTGSTPEKAPETSTETTPARVTETGDIITAWTVSRFLPWSLSRLAFENAPQRKETGKAYTFTVCTNKTPSRGYMKAKHPGFCFSQSNGIPPPHPAGF